MHICRERYKQTKSPTAWSFEVEYAKVIALECAKIAARHSPHAAEEIKHAFNAEQHELF